MARLRRLGHGVWIFVYIVINYDEEFQMHAPGNLTEDFAIKACAMTLARALRCPIEDVILKSKKKETP